MLVCYPGFKTARLAVFGGEYGKVHPCKKFPTELPNPKNIRELLADRKKTSLRI